MIVSLGGEGSNLDSRLQRTLCCRYTTPDPERRYAVRRRSCAVWSDAVIPATVGTSMGSLIKKRRKRMRKKKHKKLLKKTRWQRRQQGK
jgi:hypothetical protein